MVNTLYYIFISVLLVSLISFVGVFFLALKKNTLNKCIEIFVSFAAGSLLGNAFFHLLPESAEQIGENSFVWVMISFLFFFIMEKFFQWRHCHKEDCEIHSFTYLSLAGDAIHNFIDGAVIAASFLTNFSLGISATLAIIFHEIPQEIGDFAILIYGGWGKKKALFFNFITALTAVVGALMVCFFSKQISSLLPVLLAFAAGGFIYLAGTDLIPELHKRKKFSKTLVQFISIAAGVALIWLLKNFY